MPDRAGFSGPWGRFEAALAGAIPLGVYQAFTRRPAIGLVYHAVAPEPLDHLRHIYPAKTPAMFEADLAYLRDHYRVISYPEFRSGPGSAAAALLTFDDGYRECLTHVRPLLETYGLPGIFFVTTAFLDNQRLFYRNKYSLCAARLQEIPESRIPEVLAAVRNRFGQDLAARPALLRWLRSLNYTEAAVLDEICDLLAVDVDHYLQTRQPYLTSEEVRALAAAGHTIGAHSRRHPKLNLLPREAQAEEIVESCRTVQALTGQDQVPFAFPFSGYGLDRRFLADLQAAHPLIGTFFDSKGVRRDKGRVLNRIWADPPAAPESAGSNLPQLIHAAYQENARWRPRYLARVLAARLRGDRGGA